MIKAAIIAGDHPDLPKLVQLLHDHPDVELMAYADPENVGRQLDDIYPALTGETELKISGSVNPADVDVVFVAARKGSARNFMETNTIPDKLYVIDMAGDYRTPYEGNRFVQGIPELNRKAMVRGARYVAQPDPVTMAVALSLLPLAKNRLLDSPIHTQVVTHEPSAESNSLSAGLLPTATAVQLASALSILQENFEAPVTGVEFVGDTTEGLIAVTTVDTPVAIDEITRMYEDFYDDHSFTFIVDGVPDITDARDTNKSFIHLDKKGDTLVVTTVMDTSLKGGAGNAIHAMNLLFGLLEKVGL